jgi:hypothetical protein
MMVIEEAEIPLAFSVWARGGQAPLRAQTSLFTDLLAGGPVGRRTCWPADLLAGGPVGRRTCRGTSRAGRRRGRPSSWVACTVRIRPWPPPRDYIAPRGRTRTEWKTGSQGACSQLSSVNRACVNPSRFGRLLPRDTHAVQTHPLLTAICLTIDCT